MESVSNALPEKPRRIDSAIGFEDTEMSEAPVLGDEGYLSIEATKSIDSHMEGSPMIQIPGNGQAVPPLDEEPLLLYIGAGSGQQDPQDLVAVSESPTPTSENVYDEAYRKDVARIRQEQGQSATVYLTKWVE